MFKKIVFLGSPGAGKGTVAKVISKLFDIPHISTGDIIRASIANKTPLGIKVKEIVEIGELVSDQMTFELVKERFLEDDIKKGYILDGFPRTVSQAEMFESFDKIDISILFDIKEEEVIKRLSGRRIHASSGRTYHVLYNPPKVENKDDISGEELIIREDDKEEAIKNRLKIYHDLTFPIISFYQEKNLLKKIDASLKVEEVLKKVEEILKN